LQAVLKNKTWNLKEKNTSSNGNQKVQAKDLWNQICKAAWTCADPGIQFHDEINLWNTCQSETIHASNPCSEFMFLDDTACNLASINLAHFIDDQNEFLIDDFLQTTKVLILAQDILVSLSGYPTEKIAERSFQYRPLGLGISNLATFFLKKILPYDSQEARDWAAYICSLLTGAAYLQSSEIARHFTSGKKNGSFLAYSKNKKSMIQVLKKHQMHLQFLNASVIPPEFLKATENIWKKTLEQAQKTGVRNAQISALAPTGTISFIMDCETTGIEPEFSWLKTKALADGGSIQSVNHTMKKTLVHLGYTDEDITLLIQHLHKHNTLSGCSLLDPAHRLIFQTALDQNPEMCLSKESHLKMMAACQPFISGAISKTVNLPQSTTVEEISEIYFLAWKLKLKSVAVYRDQSKLFQPLTQNVDELNCMECA
ncbi:MAG: Vitamin B12-dependent ribonucleotide reductase, partial [Pseudobdellovibrionaceae bacterium]